MIKSKEYVFESLAQEPSDAFNNDQNDENINKINSENYKINVAGFLIYSSMLSNAWRKRSERIQDLKDSIKSLKETARKAQENLEWKNSCYLEKQYENEDLTCQFRINQGKFDDQDKAIAEMMSIINNLQHQKRTLLAQINKRSEECMSSNMQVSDLKHQLMQVSKNNCNLKSELENERSKLKDLEASVLMTEQKIDEYKVAVKQREKLLTKTIEKLDKEIQSTKIERKLLKAEILDLEDKTSEMVAYVPKNSEASTKLEKRLLCKQVSALKKTLERTLERKIFKNSLVVFSMFIRVLKMISPAFPVYGGCDCPQEIELVVAQ